MAEAVKAAVRVRLLPHRSVLIEGRAVQAGDEVDVPAVEAESLIADGYAEPATNPKRSPKPKLKLKPAAAPKRKPLTVEAVEDGEGNVG